MTSSHTGRPVESTLTYNSHGALSASAEVSQLLLTDLRPLLAPGSAVKHQPVVHSEAWGSVSIHWGQFLQSFVYRLLFPVSNAWAYCAIGPAYVHNMSILTPWLHRMHDTWLVVLPVVSTPVFHVLAMCLWGAARYNRPSVLTLTEAQWWNSIDYEIMVLNTMLALMRMSYALREATFSRADYTALLCEYMPGPTLGDEMVAQGWVYLPDREIVKETLIAVTAMGSSDQALCLHLSRPQYQALLSKLSPSALELLGSLLLETADGGSPTVGGAVASSVLRSTEEKGYRAQGTKAGRGAANALPARGTKKSISPNKSLFRAKSKASRVDDESQDVSPEFATGNVYIRWELVLGGGYSRGVEGSTAAEMKQKVARHSARTQTFKDVVVKDFSAPELAPDSTDDGSTVTFKALDSVQRVPVPEELDESEKGKLPPLLFYSVWLTDRGLMKSDLLLAEGSVPASSFFVLSTDRWNDMCLPLRVVHQGQGKGGGMLAGGLELTDNTIGDVYILASHYFAPSRIGILSITLHEARELKDVETLGGSNMDVYCKMSIGEAAVKHPGAPIRHGYPQPVKSITIVEGGVDASFGDQELLMWIDAHTFSYGEPLLFSVWDENNLARDTLVGFKPLDLREVTQDTLQHSTWLQLVDLKGAVAGEVAVDYRWHPAGELSVFVDKARNLDTADALWGNDAYVQLKLESRIRSHVSATGVATQSGTDPAFQELFVFDVVDHTELRVEVWDKDKFTRNDLIGVVIVDLVNVYKEGVVDGWAGLKKKGEWGGFDDAGELRLEVDFLGPPKVGYPMLRSDVIAHDDRLRRARGGLNAEQELAKQAAEAAKEAQLRAEREQALRELSGEDFSDADIEAAFREADLDGNLVITAGELKHLLVCMGELATDLEIDEMVRMCDKDGDGSVAFYEFYQMAKTSLVSLMTLGWNPGGGEKDFRDAVNVKVKPPPIIIYGPNGQPLQVIDPEADIDTRKRAMLRVQDLNRKAEKKNLCETVCHKHKLRLPELQRAHKKFVAMPSVSDGYATLAELLDGFDVDVKGTAPETAAEIQTWKELYAVFVRSGQARVNTRELLMAMSNFCGCSKNQRTNFAFHLFDTDESGQLSYDELVQILKANHLAEDAAVRRKADSIMAAVDKDGSNSITIEEFVVVASRFPNVVFPNFNIATDEVMGDAEKVGPDGVNTREAMGKATDEQARLIAAKSGRQ